MFTRAFWKKIGLSFARAAVPTFALGALNVYEKAVGGGELDLGAGKAALLALLVGAGAAGIRAAQALFTNLEPAAAPDKK